MTLLTGSKRFGNCLEKEKCPPPDEYMEDLWSQAQRFIKSVCAVDCATAKQLMKLPIDQWIKACTRNLDLTGEVWGTVTGRERLWYSFFFSDSEMQQPNLMDVRQPIGAGAKRGLLWKLRKEGLITDGQEIPSEQMEDILERLCSKPLEFEAAFAEAMQWLKTEVKKAAGRKLETRAQQLVEQYEPLFAEIKVAGPPCMPGAENGECDGGKTIEGIFDPGKRPRKLYLLGEGRDTYGRLEKPKRFMYNSSCVVDDVRMIARKWLYPPASNNCTWERAAQLATEV